MSRLRILPVAVVMAAIGAGLLLHLGGSVNAAETREVDIDNYTFSPGDLVVPAGTTVTWVNHDETPHTVVATGDPHAFRSGGLDTDDKFSVTFTKPGVYSYLCTVHPYMTGKVVVR